MRNEKYWQYYKTKKMVPFFHRAGLCQAKIYRPFGILIFGRNAGTLRGMFREGRRNRGLSPFIPPSARVSCRLPCGTQWQIRRLKVSRTTRTTYQLGGTYKTMMPNLTFERDRPEDRKSTRLNSSHSQI